MAEGAIGASQKQTYTLRNYAVIFTSCGKPGRMYASRSVMNIKFIICRPAGFRQVLLL